MMNLNYLAAFGETRGRLFFYLSFFGTLEHP